MADEYTVYVIQVASGPVKIGYTKKPLERLVDLQMGNHLHLKYLARVAVASLKEARQVEQALHDKFAEWAIRGEWYGVDAEIAVDALRKSVENGAFCPPYPICGFCGKTIHSHRREYCTDEHRKAAYRERRGLVGETLVRLFGVTEDQASEALETAGLEKITTRLAELGYGWDTTLHNWAKVS